MREIINQEIRSGLVRLLSNADLNPYSITYGCLDRSFWYYKTLREFPSSAFQQGVLAIAALQDDPNLQSAGIDWKALLNAGLSYWISIQHQNGAYDEWYLNEKSYCPTAFATAAQATILMRYSKSLLPELRPRLEASVRKSCEWLLDRPNWLAGNQVVAAYVGLALAKKLGILNGDTANRIEEFWQDLLRFRTDEGWFPESGGFDFGYSSKVLDLLALGSEADPRLVPVALDLIRYLCHFVEDDYYLHGVLNSRDTAHFFPYGLTFFRNHDAHARNFFDHFQTLLRSEKIPVPSMVDDWYFSYFFLNSFALSQAELSRSQDDLSSAPELQGESPNYRIFKSSKLMKVIRPVRCYVNLGNGTYAIKTSSGWKTDGGYLCKPDQSDSAILHHNYGSPNFSNYEIKESGGNLEAHIRLSYRYSRQGLPLAKWTLAFKFFSKYFLRSDTLSRWFHGWIKNRQIHRTMQSPHQLARKLVFGSNGLEVLDKNSVSSETSIAIGNLSTVHSPSRLNSPQDILK